MADSTIILYLGFLVGLISYLEKLGQCDLNKNYVNLQKKVFQTSSKEPPGRFQ